MEIRQFELSTGGFDAMKLKSKDLSFVAFVVLGLLLFVLVLGYI